MTCSFSRLSVLSVLAYSALSIGVVACSAANDPNLPAAGQSEIASDASTAKDGASTSMTGTTGGDAGMGTGSGNGSGSGSGSGSGNGNGGGSDAGSPASDAGAGLGQFGDPCSAPSDCASDACFMGGLGSYCSILCPNGNGDCPVPPTSGVCNKQGYCKK